MDETGHRFVKCVITLGLIAVLAIWMVLTWMLFTAEAHMADSGWEYGTDCCSKHDCYVIAAPLRVVAVQGGFLLPTGEIVPYNDRRLRKSGDSDYHMCKPKSAKAARCLYVPPFEG